MCKRFHRISEPLFFKSIRINLQSSPPPGPSLTGNAKFDRLINILDRRKELWGFIQRLHITFPFGVKPVQITQYNHMLREILIPKMPALRVISLEGPVSFGDLTLYPGRDTDDIEPDSCAIEDWIVSKRQKERGFSFPLLKTFIWQAQQRWFDNRPGLDLEGPFFPPGVSNITDLRLYSQGPYSYYDHTLPRFIPAIINAITTLKCFHLETSRSSPAFNETALTKEFHEALYMHKSTLEELFIGSSDWAVIQEPPYTPYVSFDLSGLTRIRRLGLPEPLIARGNDRVLVAGSGIPPHVEFLQLQYPMGYTSEADVLKPLRIASMERFLIKAPEPFPKAFRKLSTVIFWLQQVQHNAGWTYGYGSALDDLQDRFKHPVFDWLSTPYARETPFFPSDNWSRPPTVTPR